MIGAGGTARVAGTDPVGLRGETAGTGNERGVHPGRRNPRTIGTTVTGDQARARTVARTGSGSPVVHRAALPHLVRSFLSLRGTWAGRVDTTAAAAVNLPCLKEMVKTGHKQAVVVVVVVAAVADRAEEEAAAGRHQGTAPVADPTTGGTMDGNGEPKNREAAG